MNLWEFYCCLSFLGGGFSHILSRNTIHRNEESLSGLKELADKICSEYDYDYIAVTNKYVDDYLLNDWNKYLVKNNADTILLPPFQAVVNWHAHDGNVSLDNGWLQGLLTAKRYRNVLIKKNYPYVKISVPLTLKNLKVGYTYFAKIRHVQVIGTVNGTSLDSKLILDLDINILNYRASLDDFKFINPGKISADFDGNLISHVPNVLIDTLFPVMKTIFRSVIEEYVVDNFSAMFEKHNYVTCFSSENCAGPIVAN